MHIYTWMYTHIQCSSNVQKTKILHGFAQLCWRNGQLLPMKDAYKLAIDAFDILVKEKTLGRINVPVGAGRAVAVPRSFPGRPQ